MSLAAWHMAVASAIACAAHLEDARWYTRTTAHALLHHRSSFPEVTMQHPVKIPDSKQRKRRSNPKEDAVQQQQKAEMAEMLGRHKNIGQKDHKGAR